MTRTGDRPGGRNAVGVAFLVASNGLTATVDAGAKLLSDTFGSIQIVWGYSAGIFAVLMVYALLGPVPLRRALATRRPGLQLARPLMLVLTISTLFLGVTHLPLADATAISFAAPLFVVALSGPVLGERVGAHRWLGVVVGLAGVAMVMRPGTNAFHWAALVVLASALFFAIFQIMTRQLAATEETFTTLLYTGAGALAWSSLAVGFAWRELSPGHWLVFAALGVLGAGAHLCMIKAFAAAQASLLAPFNYVKLVWAALLGFLVFGDVPGAWVVAGAAVIALSGAYVLLREPDRR